MISRLREESREERALVLVVEGSPGLYFVRKHSRSGEDMASYCF
jgi:hypothetical protein